MPIPNLGTSLIMHRERNIVIKHKKNSPLTEWRKHGLEVTPIDAKSSESSTQMSGLCIYDQVLNYSDTANYYYYARAWIYGIFH